MIHRLNFGWGRSALRWLGILGILFSLGGCPGYEISFPGRTDSETTVNVTPNDEPPTFVTVKAHAVKGQFDLMVRADRSDGNTIDDKLFFPLAREDQSVENTIYGTFDVGRFGISDVFVKRWASRPDGSDKYTYSAEYRFRVGRSMYDYATGKPGVTIRRFEFKTVNVAGSTVSARTLTVVMTPSAATPSVAISQIGSVIASAPAAGQSLTVAQSVKWADLPPEETPGSELDSVIASIRAINSATPIKTVNFAKQNYSHNGSAAANRVYWMQPLDSSWEPSGVTSSTSPGLAALARYEKGFAVRTALPGTGSYVLEVAARRNGAVVATSSSVMNVVIPPVPPSAAISLPALANTRVGGTVQFDARASNIPQGAEFSYYAKKGGQPMPAGAVTFASTDTKTPVATINQAPDEVVIRIRYKNADDNWQTLEGTTGNIASRFLTGS